MPLKKTSAAWRRLPALKKSPSDQLEIIQGDGLEIDLIASVPAPRKIVANLPYNAGTHMLLSWLDAIYQDPASFTSLTLMFQKEVAARIAADPGGKECSSFSVLVQWLCDARYDMELPPGAFLAAAQSKLGGHHTYPARAAAHARSASLRWKNCWARRSASAAKMLRSALKPLNCDVPRLLARSGVMETMRAEQLDVMTLCQLAAEYEKRPF